MKPREIELPEIVAFKPKIQRIPGFLFRTTAPERPWMDISYEYERTYTFQTLHGTVKYTFQNPAFLDVSGSGHRLVTQNDMCYWIDPKTGNIIEWKVTKGEPHFVLNSGWREKQKDRVTRTKYGNWICCICNIDQGFNKIPGVTQSGEGPVCEDCLKKQTWHHSN